MERFFLNTWIVSVYVGREATSDFGARYNGDTAELWVGKTYVCVDFSRRRIRCVTRFAIYIGAAFTIGLYLDPPAFAETALHAVQDVVLNWMMPDSPL